MNRKQKIIVSVTGIFLVLLILVGLTYAYFLTKINGNTNDKSSSVTTANLELKYDDINDILISENAVEPGKSWVKTFSATNKGKKAVTYGVALENLINTLERTQDLVYTLECKQYLKAVIALCDEGIAEKMAQYKAGLGEKIEKANKELAEVKYEYKC